MLSVEIEIQASEELSYNVARDLDDQFGLYLEGNGKNLILGDVTEDGAAALLKFATNPSNYFKSEWEGFNGIRSIKFSPFNKKKESKKSDKKKKISEAFNGDILTFDDFCDDMEFSAKMRDALKAFIKSTDGTDVDDDSSAPRTDWLNLLDNFKENGDYWDIDDEPEADAADQFSIELVDDNGNVGYVTFNKRGSKWVGRFVTDASDPEFETPDIGLNYMGYLDPKDVATWIRKDCKGKYVVSVA